MQVHHRLTAALGAMALVAGGVVVAGPTTAHAATPHLPELSVGELAIVEGHSATRSARIPVTLDGPAASTVTVTWTAAPGTATAGSSALTAIDADFKAASGTLTFKAGTVSKTINLAVYGDSRIESDETILVSLTGAGSAATIADPVGTVTILDDEATPGTVVSVGDVTVSEGDARTRSVTFPLTLSRPAPGTTVSYRVVAGTATGGWSGAGAPPSGADVGDRNGMARSVSFTSTSVQKHLKVAVSADLVDETDETFAVVIDSVIGGATAGRNGTGTVLDADPARSAADPAFGPSATLVGTLDPTSTLVGCGSAATRIVATSSIHLDPACTYARGVTIATSNVTLDCRGAQVAKSGGPGDGHGILVRAPVGVALHDVTIRNCNVRDFDNNLRVTRVGFKDLVVGSEYDLTTSNIVIENSSFADSANSGIFVDAFVSDVRIADSAVTGSGNVGIYLEAGSRDNVLAGNIVADNGWEDVVPGPATTVIGGTVVEYISTGREGIAVDGSRNNLIRDNLVTSNAAGGIFLYKNCGENVSDPGHWVRRYGADDNVVTHNVVADGPNGVWVGSRASQNQLFMDCSDPPYVNDPATLRAVYLDPAERNVIEYNRIIDMQRAIRVEADDTTVRGNWIEGGTDGVLLGTWHRTTVLGQPVDGAVIAHNTTVGVTRPFSWVWGKGATTFSGNVGNGVNGSLAAGTSPTIDPFLFVVAFV
jgi:parallel beta-helix repeat protein